MRKQQAVIVKSELRAIHSNSGDWKLYAAQNGISRATAYRCINSEISGFLLKGGSRKTAIDEAKSRFIEQLIEKLSNPRLSLKALTEWLNSQWSTNTSSETVRRHLDGLMYTLKQVCLFVINIFNCICLYLRFDLSQNVRCKN